jgi:hypothetical protein
VSPAPKQNNQLEKPSPIEPKMKKKKRKIPKQKKPGETGD